VLWSWFVLAGLLVVVVVDVDGDLECVGCDEKPVRVLFALCGEFFC
jgi:hypothetical protein